MDSKDTLKRIKVLLGMEKKEVEIVVETPVVEQLTEVVLAEMKLKDGTIVAYDKLETGGTLQIRDTNDALIPATQGDYELEDGTKLTVDGEGIITAVVAPESATPVDTPAETPEVEVEAPKTEGEDKMKMLEDRIAILEEAINTLLSNFSKVEENFDKKLEDFGSQAAGTPVFAQPIVEAKPLTSGEARMMAIDSLKSINKKRN